MIGWCDAGTTLLNHNHAGQSVSFLLFANAMQKQPMAVGVLTYRGYHHQKSSSEFLLHIPSLLPDNGLYKHIVSVSWRSLANHSRCTESWAMFTPIALFVFLFFAIPWRATFLDRHCWFDIWCLLCLNSDIVSRGKSISITNKTGRQRKEIRTRIRNLYWGSGCFAF